MQDAGNEFLTWYKSIPIITRTYLSAVVVLMVVVSVGIISPYYLFYTPSLTIYSLQLWRPFTALCFMGKFDFNILFSLYYAYFVLQKVERQVFQPSTTPDLIWLMLLMGVGVVLVASFVSVGALSSPFIMALMYIWSKRFPYEQIIFYFGIRIKSGYFPWIYAVWLTLFNNSFLSSLIGIGLGHLYIFVKDILVVTHHKDYLPTPQWLKRLWNRQEPGQPNAFRPFEGRGMRMD